MGRDKSTSAKKMLYPVFRIQVTLWEPIPANDVWLSSKQSSRPEDTYDLLIIATDIAKKGAKLGHQMEWAMVIESSLNFFAFVQFRYFLQHYRLVVNPYQSQLFGSRIIIIIRIIISIKFCSCLLENWRKFVSSAFCPRIRFLLPV